MTRNWLTIWLVTVSSLSLALLGCGGSNIDLSTAAIVEGTVQTLSSRQAELSAVSSGAVEVYLDGQKIASGGVFGGRFRVTVPLQGLNEATAVVTATFARSGQMRTLRHKTIVRLRIRERTTAQITPTTTLATAALEIGDNHVPSWLDIQAFNQAQQAVQGQDVSQVDFTKDDAIRNSLPLMLVITSNPSDARVQIGNQPQQNTTPLIIRSGLQGGRTVNLQVSHQAIVNNQQITTTLSKSVTLKARGSTPVHFDFTPQIVGTSLQNGTLTLQVKSAGSTNEKVIVRFNEISVIATIVELNAEGVATVNVQMPSGVSGQVQVRVQNAVYMSAPVAIKISQ